MPREIPLQQDMFTREWVDARSTKQRQLDYERDLAPGTQLDLFSSPPLTKNELADEPQREGTLQQSRGESMAHLLFDAASLPDEQSLTPETEPTVVKHQKSQYSAYDLYMDLVMLCEEQAKTVWIDPLYAHEYVMEIAGLMVAARNAGLSTPELQAAIQIGTWRGTQRKREYEEGEAQKRTAIQTNGSA